MCLQLEINLLSSFAFSIRLVITCLWDVASSSMVKSFIHYTIDVVSLVKLICNEKLLFAISYQNQHDQKKKVFIKNNGEIQKICNQ